MPKALVTGITGQDGSYLAELLLAKGYEVHGMIRKASTFNTERIEHIYQDPHDPAARLFLHYGDLANAEQLTNLIYNVRPDEIYHLGALIARQGELRYPRVHRGCDRAGTTRILDAVRRSGVKAPSTRRPRARCSAAPPSPQSETTTFQPRSPYAIAKVYSYWMAVNYRQAYGVFATNGILFNHESPRRGATFVTRKVTRAVAGSRRHAEEGIPGKPWSKRDSGVCCRSTSRRCGACSSGDAADDFVLGTGKSHSVRELVEEAFGYAGPDCTTTSRSIRATSDRPRSTSCRRMPPRLAG